MNKYIKYREKLIEIRVNLLINVNFVRVKYISHIFHSVVYCENVCYYIQFSKTLCSLE